MGRASAGLPLIACWLSGQNADQALVRLGSGSAEAVEDRGGDQDECAKAIPVETLVTERTQTTTHCLWNRSYVEYMPDNILLMIGWIRRWRRSRAAFRSA